jgi:4-amino-4-deoxy-L-arabinose transferase-like glycosyltransferase
LNRFSLVGLLILLAAFAVAYTSNLAGWLISDDEGSDFYEVWQFQEGKTPGVDFLAEQQPLYLFIGKAVIAAAGRNPAALRFVSVVQLILGVTVLTLTLRYLFNNSVALLSALLILTCGLIVQLGRLFRPDPMMLAWEMVGLSLAMVAAQYGRRRWWAAAGAAYGIALLFKPFAVFPLVGLVFYFLYEFWRRRQEWQVVFLDGLAFAAAFLLVGGGISALLHSQTGWYYLEAFNQHVSLGQGAPLSGRLSIMLRYYGALFIVNGVFLGILPLWFVNRRLPWQAPAAIRLLISQLASPLIFLGITRPVFLRYYVFMIPVLAILLAWQLATMWQKISQDYPRLHRLAPLFALMLTLFLLWTTQPKPITLITRRETDTLALAALVAQNTTAADKVLSDYAEINFHAGRPSIYEASIIAAGRIQGRIMTGQLLIERMEAEKVNLVLIHVPGGTRPPDHLYYLYDYDRFRAYLESHYRLLTTFDRAGQLIEIHQRNEP